MTELVELLLKPLVEHTDAPALAPAQVEIPRADLVAAVKRMLAQ